MSGPGDNCAPATAITGDECSVQNLNNTKDTALDAATLAWIESTLANAPTMTDDQARAISSLLWPIGGAA